MMAGDNTRRITQTSRRIKEAARMKVEGATWAVVALKFGYSSADTCKKTLSQTIHLEEWRAAYEEARADRLNDIEVGAILTQVELSQRYVTVPAYEHIPEKVFENRDQIRQAAAHSLLAHCAKLKAKEVGDVNINVGDSVADELRKSFAEAEDKESDRVPAGGQE